jgi:hypothetical protein
MSDVSRDLLSTDNKGVHEQVDVLVAAMLVYRSLLEEASRVNSTLRSNQKKWIKKEVKRALRQLGYSSWFVLPGLTYYAFEFWEVIVRERLGHTPNESDLLAFEQAVLQECGRVLDEQYAHEGLADVIGYLKAI